MTAGDIARCYPEHIHSVRNVGKDISMSLHTYGRHINYTGRSEFDLEHKLEKPYVIKIAYDEYAALGIATAVIMTLILES